LSKITGVEADALLLDDLRLADIIGIGAGAKVFSWGDRLLAAIAA
jgi:hypothetical protein